MTKPFLTAAAVLAALTIAPGALAQSVSGSGSVNTDVKTMPDSSNKGGALRGLDRANEAAGDRGAHGRANATTKQGITTGSGGSSADVKAKAKVKGSVD